MHDDFRPHQIPAKMIYDAFQEEAKKRKGRTVDEWMNAERHAVLLAAEKVSKQFGFPAPTFTDVCGEETSASGHIDYGSKWAYGIINLMKRKAA